MYIAKGWSICEYQYFQRRKKINSKHVYKLSKPRNTVEVAQNMTLGGGGVYSFPSSVKTQYNSSNHTHVINLVDLSHNCLFSYTNLQVFRKSLADLPKNRIDRYEVFLMKRTFCQCRGDCIDFNILGIFNNIFTLLITRFLSCWTFSLISNFCTDLKTRRPQSLKVS